MLNSKPNLKRTLAVALLLGAGLLLVISSALAFNSMLVTWQDLYTHSATGDAGCLTCHGSKTKTLNAYGKDLCIAFDGSIPADITLDLQAIESTDSDGDGSSNLAEIAAGSQPGWTGGENPLYYTSDRGCAPTGRTVSVPSGVPLPYDPPTAGDPVADPNGPYAGYVDVPISFDGSDSYDSDGGSITSYSWDFGDGSSGSGMTAEHVYTAAGIYTVTLTVVDDEGTNNSSSTTATISAESVLDLDIASFKVARTARTGKPLTIELSVENAGTVLGQAIATVTGIQDDVEVYNWSLNVYDYIGKGDSNFTFPSHTPTAKGTINWTVTIADVDADVDLATATTTVK